MPTSPSNRTELLHRSWARAWQGLKAQGDGLAAREALITAYAEPQRHYHSLQHLGECLAAFERVMDQARDGAAVAMALWFHDAVYALRASDNEARSAELAVRTLSAAGVDAARVQAIDDLVMATRHDAVPVDADAQLLVDIDLSILGAERERFDEYERQIRAEYAFVPALIFNPKRRQILRGFLDRPRIYSTPAFAALEPVARANLARACGLD